VLTQLAEHYAVQPSIDARNVCVDNRLQWPQAKNVWRNAAIHTAVTAPVRAVRRLL